MEVVTYNVQNIQNRPGSRNIQKCSTKYICEYQALSQVPSKYKVLLQVPIKYQVLMQIPSKYQVLWQIPSAYENTKQVPSTLASTDTLASTKQVPSTFASSASFSPISKLLDVRSSPGKHHSIPNFLPNLFMAKATRSEPRYLV